MRFAPFVHQALCGAVVVVAVAGCGVTGGEGEGVAQRRRHGHRRRHERDQGDVGERVVVSHVRGAHLLRRRSQRRRHGVAGASELPDEEANGVAVTSNIFNSSGLDPAFTVNVQLGGDAEVVHPPAGVCSDLLLLYFSQPNQPTTYISRSSLTAPGETVLTSTQLRELGVALQAIHTRFAAAYGPASGNDGFYAMDVEFKFDDDDAPDAPPHLFIKQARPYPGREQVR